MDTFSLIVLCALSFAFGWVVGILKGLNLRFLIEHLINRLTNVNVVVSPAKKADETLKE
jgi:hypothetical protein|uniref:Uncharacterized protein n=1 Tax=Siphoviridae sp. ctoic9 TaxID=2825671 RepID=A0A8S5QAS1_9CAUD|nr:MAG TPA: Protein of unknown function (DUF502) [Siphoviridae sp. ctoic9]